MQRTRGILNIKNTGKFEEKVERAEPCLHAYPLVHTTSLQMQAEFNLKVLD